MKKSINVFAQSVSLYGVGGAVALPMLPGADVYGVIAARVRKNAKSKGASGSDRAGTVRQQISYHRFRRSK
jgi:hypothetical protein